MKKQKKLYQFKSTKLWKDSITLGFAIFGGLSAIATILGFSYRNEFENIWVSLFLTILTIVISYLVAVVILWSKIKEGVTLKIRGINVTVCQGDLFNQPNWKVIGVDNEFNMSEDDRTISHSSIHGQLIKQMKNDGKLEELKRYLESENKNTFGSIITYENFMLLALTTLNEQHEAHIDSLQYEGILRKMWQEIGRTYSNRPVYLPILGDGITRFDGVGEKPSSFDLLKCMLCTLKTSNVQLRAPVTIVIYDRMNEISLYDLKKSI